MDKLNLTFATVIAYLIPGVIGLLALQPHSRFIHELFAGATAATSLSGLTLIALLGFGFGLFLNALAGFTTRPLIKYFGGKTVTAAMLAALHKDQSGHYQSAIENQFRYFEFYSNTAQALALVFLSTLLADLNLLSPEMKRILVSYILLPGVIGVLLRAAHRCFANYYEQIKHLAERKPQPHQGE